MLPAFDLPQWELHGLDPSWRPAVLAGHLVPRCYPWSAQPSEQLGRGALHRLQRLVGRSLQRRAGPTQGGILQPV